MKYSRRMWHTVYGTMRLIALGTAAALVIGCGKSAPPTELKVEVEKAPASAPAAAALAASTAKTSIAAATSDTPGPVAALHAAAAKDRYVALMLHKKGEADTSDMVASARALSESSGKADCIVADTSNPELARLFKSLKLDAGTMPTPVILMLSTNGIVTGAFTMPPTKERFVEALLPSQPLAVLTALHEKKKAIVVVQSPTTQGNAETDKGIAEYLSSITNRGSYVMVKIALDNAENAPFLRQIKINPQTETQSVTLIMAPPMNIATTPIRGAATKAVLGKAMGACSSGSCGPAG